MVPLNDAHTQELFTNITSAVAKFCHGESQPPPALDSPSMSSSEEPETTTPPATISQEDFVTWLSNVQFVRVNPMEKAKGTIEEPASGVPSMTEDYKDWLKH